MVSNRDTIGSLIGSTPSLKADRVAQVLLRDPILLLNWLFSENIARYFRRFQVLWKYVIYLRMSLTVRFRRSEFTSIELKLSKV